MGVTHFSAEMYKAALISLAVLFGLCNGQSLNVLSFNVRQFGRSKYSNQEVVDTLIEVFYNTF